MDVGELLSYQPNRGTKRPGMKKRRSRRCVGNKLVLENVAAIGKKK